MIPTRRLTARWGLLGAVLLLAASLWIGIDRLNRQEKIIHSGRTSVDLMPLLEKVIAANEMFAQA